MEVSRESLGVTLAETPTSRGYGDWSDVGYVAKWDFHWRENPTKPSTQNVSCLKDAKGQR